MMNLKIDGSMGNRAVVAISETKEKQNKKSRVKNLGQTNLSNGPCGIRIALALCADVRFENEFVVFAATAVTIVLFKDCDVVKLETVLFVFDIGTVLTVHTLVIDVNCAVVDGI